MSVVGPDTDLKRPKATDRPAAGRVWFVAGELILLAIGLIALVAGVLGAQRLLNHSFFWAPADGHQLSPGRARELLWLSRLTAVGVFAFVVMGLQRRANAEAVAGRIIGEFASSLRALVAALRREFASFPAVAWLSLATVTVIGAAVRIRYLFEPLRYDEAFTYATYAIRPVRAFLQDYSWPNNHLFHTILVHVSTRLFGPEPWAIRLPALIAGILTIPAAGLLFARMFDLLSGVLAAALVAASSILIEYSVNARGYSIQVLIFLLLLALALHLRRQRSLAGWVLLIVLSSVGFFTIPTMLYPFGIVLGWLVLLSILAPEAEPPRRMIPRVLIAGFATIALTAFLYSPIILYQGTKPLVGNQFVAPMTRSQWVHGLPLAMQRIWVHANRGLPVAIGVLLSAGVLLYLLFARGERRRDVVLLIVALLWCPLLVTFQRVIPFTRVWIFLEPIYLGLAAAGFVAVARLTLRTSDDRPREGEAPVRLSSPKSAAQERARTTRLGGNLALPVNSNAHPGRRSAALVAGPPIIAILLGLLVLRSRTAIDTGEAFPQAADLAAFFDKDLGDRDRVLAIFPAEAPLRYLGLTHPRLGRAMAASGEGHRRLLVVIRPADQVPEQVPKELGVATVDCDPPRLVHAVPGAAVYELRRRGS